MSYRDNVVLANRWADLKDYGIDPLTGEACAYNQRLLCDISKEGATLLKNFFGCNIDFINGTNWNSGVGMKSPAVSSIMLPKGILDDLRIFILFHIHNKPYVYVMPGDTIIGTDEQEPVADGAKMYTNPAITSSAPMKDGRNVHQMSGRVK